MLLIVYDVFFVFFTDIMRYVAVLTALPNKFLFPQGIETGRFHIYGLGDVVIPGIFMSMCLRFDYLKSL